MSKQQNHIKIQKGATLFYEDGNDFVFDSAVEKDSLIAFLWHVLSFLSFGCLERSNSLIRARLNYQADKKSI